MKICYNPGVKNTQDIVFALENFTADIGKPTITASGDVLVNFPSVNTIHPEKFRVSQVRLRRPAGYAFHRLRGKAGHC